MTDQDTGLEHANPDDAPGARVVAGLSRIGAVLRSEARQGARDRKLTPTQGQILACLAARPGTRLRLNDIAATLAITAATASESVRVLTEKGLVRKRRDPTDARALGLELTASGKREAQRTAQWPDLLVSAAAELEPREQDALLKAVVKIVKRLQDDGRVQAARLCVTCRHFRPKAHDDPERPHHCALVDAAFGDRHLRVDCDEHEPAESALQLTNWAAFTSPNAASDDDDFERNRR
ncbi:MAG: winged helix-turn-helix transcriptional regulator [Planctomycetes bacterium]|nr:winged helix-turn-helix transcriptional regulator [Planctomycetota bacterium]